MKQQSKKASLNKALESLKQLTFDFHNNLDERFTFPFAMHFNSREDGGIYLNTEEAAHYRECLDQILKSTGREEHISAKAIDKMMKQCILSSLDINKRRLDRTIQERIDEAIVYLKSQITASLEVFKVYIPIAGLSTDGLPAEMGYANFVVFDEKEANTVREHFVGKNISEERKRTQIEMVNNILGDEAIGHPVVVIEVSAVEPEAARKLALKEVRLTIDAINFFSDFVPFSHGHIYLPGEEEQTRVAIPVLHQTEPAKNSLQSQLRGPVDDFSLARLKEENNKKKYGLDELDALLKKDRTKLNGLEKRVLAAVQWAGRATIDKRSEEAFLLYAIALESIILADADKDELTYRLRVRVAHLLGTNVEERKLLFTDVGRMYNIRSSIVHNGTYEVLDEDLRLIRLLAKSCIVRVIISEPFKFMTSPTQLADWFSHQVLK